MSDNEQTNKNRKTLADIVAMVRWAAQSYEGEAEKSEGLLRKSFELSAANYRIIADLVEAAWKRERAKVESDALSVGGIVEAARTAEKSSAVGNTAAIRDALVAMVEAETEGSMDRDDLCGRCFEKMWNSCKHDGSCWVDKVMNALAAPARNCDRPECATSKAAQDVWRKEDGGKTPYYEWLFAPAEE